MQSNTIFSVYEVLFNNFSCSYRANSSHMLVLNWWIGSKSLQVSLKRGLSRKKGCSIPVRGSFMGCWPILLFMFFLWLIRLLKLFWLLFLFAKALLFTWLFGKLLSSCANWVAFYSRRALKASLDLSWLWLLIWFPPGETT